MCKLLSRNPTPLPDLMVCIFKGHAGFSPLPSPITTASPSQSPARRSETPGSTPARKLKLELKREHSSTQPAIKLGGKARVFRKRVSWTRRG